MNDDGDGSRAAGDVVSETNAAFSGKPRVERRAKGAGFPGKACPAIPFNGIAINFAQLRAQSHLITLERTPKRKTNNFG